MIVVIRYFGGTKLGVGGLINAYRTAAKESLELSSIVERTIDITYSLKFEYAFMDKIMKIIKRRKVKIVSQIMELDCNYKVSIRQKDSELFYNDIKELRCTDIKEIE